MKKKLTKLSEFVLRKTSSGIRGLDEITGGGLPAGRPTLVCGGPGCGKTLLAVEFLVRGAVEFGEPGVLMTFEESIADLTSNVASLGFDLRRLMAARKLVVDHVYVERSEIEETGSYDLDGLFIRLGHAIDAVGARRVALDTLEALFSGLSDEAVLRAELRRLFRWLKDRDVTTVITAERGERSMTRFGLEEYVSDCVILLDHRVTDQVSTRRLRVAKYRGSVHGTNEYPFLIDERGISVLPVTSLSLNHPTSDARVPTGIPDLDAMLGGQGFYRGSSVLLSGTAGCGKTSVAAHFAEMTCRRGERCLMFLFEEPPSQLIRNMRSIGLDLQQCLNTGLLRFVPARPALYGLEMHLVSAMRAIEEFRPDAVVIDPISSLSGAASEFEVRTMLIRLVDFLRVKGITVLMVHLTSGGEALERTEIQMSSLIDTWLLLRDIESAGERNRAMYVLKSRGMAHSNQIREFLLTSRGVQLQPAYVGPAGVVTGSARLAQEARDEAEHVAARQAVEQRETTLDGRRLTLEAQLAALRGELAAVDAERQLLVRQRDDRTSHQTREREAMARSRGADNRAMQPGRPRTGRQR